MGGGISSSNDNYVLHYLPEDEEDRVKPLLSIDNSNNNSSSTKPLTRSQSSNKIANLDITRSQSSNKIANLDKKIIGHDDFGDNGSSVVKLRNRSNSSTSPMKSQKSILVSQKSMAQSNQSKTNCSDKYPWLIKNVKFTASSLTDFEFGRIIGRGLMGTVRIVKYRGEKVCVFKCVKKSYVLKHNDQRHIRGEKEVLMATSKCSFCVNLFGTFQDRHYLYFALEYACGGELFQRLGRKKYFRPDTAKFYISEVFVALEYVQSLGYVYRDLKPENIILDEEGHCKLVDFGFSTSIANSSSGMLHTLCGTPAYLAPEILDGKFTNGYTEIVDWWSFGILIYELLSGKTPFSKNSRESPYEIFLRILQNRIWFPLGFDSMAKDLVTRLSLPQINKRLCKPDEIKLHPYFSVPWPVVASRRLVPPFVPKIKDFGDSHYFRNYGSDGVGDRPNLLFGDPNTEPAPPDTNAALADFSGF